MNHVGFHRFLGAPPASFANLGDFAQYITSQAQTLIGDLANGQQANAQVDYSNIVAVEPWGSYLVQLLPSTGGTQGSVITHALADVTTQLSVISPVVNNVALGGSQQPLTSTQISTAQAAAQQIISDAGTVIQQYQDATGITSVQDQLATESQNANAGAEAQAAAMAAEYAQQNAPAPDPGASVDATGEGGANLAAQAAEARNTGGSSVSTTDPTAPDDSGTAPAPTLNLPPPPVPTTSDTSTGGSTDGTMTLPPTTISAPAPTTVSMPVAVAVGIGGLGLGALLVWMMHTAVLNPVESHEPRRRRRKSRKRSRR